MGTIHQDVRFTLRQLLKNPGFALTAILSLGLGIGGTVAVFSVIYGVLLHPFPYANADRLANLSIRDGRGVVEDAWFTGDELKELQKVSAFDGIATWRGSNLTVTGRDVPENVSAMSGIGKTFSTLGVPAYLGRNLGPSDTPDGQTPQPVVELNYRFWQRHFNGDRNVIGKTLELNRKSYTIIGVTRPNFPWGWGVDVYLPQAIDDPEGGGVVVRLRRGVSLAAADAELQPLLKRFAEEHPQGFPKTFTADIRLLTWEVNRNLGGTLYLLFAGVAMLLAIGCSNVSILLLARGAAREHEFAVRSAVGAGSYRIVRQLLTESLLLAVTGTAFGIVLAWRLLALIVAWLPPNLFPPDVSVRINLPVLLFSAGLALMASIFFGLAPALRMTKPEINQIMQSGAKRAAGSVRNRRLHGVLVAGQIALTLLLLTASGAATEGFMHLLRVPLGYNPDNVVAVGIPLQENAYTTWQARTNYFEQLQASIRALPEVVSAGIAVNAVPPNSGFEQRFEMLGKPATSPDAQTARIDLVGSGYFRTLDMTLEQGRAWNPGEISRGALMAVVNEEFVKRYYPDGDILGHSIKIATLQSHPPHTLAAPGADGWLQVIGVVADRVNDGLEQPVRPEIYVPYSLQLWMGMQILVRTRANPETMTESIRRQIAAVNPDQQTLGAISTLRKWIEDEPVWERGRLISVLFGGFAVVALILSAIGLFSVVSYSVSQRTNELGIRMALGAGRIDIVKSVMASAVMSVGAGIAAGLMLSLGMSRIISSWAGSTTHHPGIAVGVSFLLAVIAAIACLAPVRRALAVDPVIALRSE